MTLIKEMKVKRHDEKITTGYREDFGEVNVKVLTPIKGGLEKFRKEEKPSKWLRNDVSITVVIEFDNTKALFTADASSKTILKGISDVYGDGEITVQYADIPHHGSLDSFNDDKFLQKIKADRWCQWTPWLL